jgi:tRNA pseudouridine55 synthase
MPPTGKEPRPPTSAVGSALILLNKQPGITSFDSLRDIKRALGTGKAGHTGTLDKFAGGLLLVLVGRALKLSRWFTHCDKQYEGTICFGSETETLDPEGAVIANAPLPSREVVEQALTQFRGEIQQAPRPIRQYTSTEVQKKKLILCKKECIVIDISSDFWRVL